MIIRLTPAVMIGFFWTSMVMAESVTPASSSGSGALAGPSGWRVAGAYILVIGLLFLLGWFLKRFPSFQRKGDTRHGMIRIQTAISVGDKCRLISVDWEGRKLLVGVTPHHMTCLAVDESKDDRLPVDPPSVHDATESPGADAPPAAFWKILTRQIRTGGRLASSGANPNVTRSDHEQK